LLKKRFFYRFLGIFLYAKWKICCTVGRIKMGMNPEGGFMRLYFKGAILTAVLLCGASLAAQETAGYRAITEHFSPRAFQAGAVTQPELDRILAAGVRSASAGNRQPWHFSVVRQSALIRRVVSGAEEGNVLIIISAPASGNNATAAAIDCALAAQSIYLSAQTLGLASRIYTGPINTVNGMKTDLGIPAANTALVLVRVGRMPAGQDALSGASPRREVSSFVTYK
jgi:nitroreductase